MASTIQNTEVKQKDADRAVVVAVTSREVFKDGPEDGRDMLDTDESFLLLKLLHTVNERLEEETPGEPLLFDVVLMTTDSRRQQQSSCIVSSAQHYGLEIGRFCFANEDDFAASLQKHNVQLFLTTDGNEASQAAQKGVLSALLDQQVASSPSDQLRVMFCEDAVNQPDFGRTPACKQAFESFTAQMGEMRRRFGMSDSPLSFILVTLHGGKDSCADSLLTLRSSGLNVDEAYCLAGAPRGQILSTLRPHVTISISSSGLEK